MPNEADSRNTITYIDLTFFMIFSITKNIVTLWQKKTIIPDWDTDMLIPPYMQVYMLCAKRGSGTNHGLPCANRGSTLAQTIHGLSQAQHDQLNTYLKSQRLQCRIPNHKYKSLTSPCVADRSPSLRLHPVFLVCGA